MVVEDTARAGQAKRYSSLRYGLAVLDTVYILGLLFIFQYFGLAKTLAMHIENAAGGIFTLPLYSIILFSGYYLLDFPLNLYQSFILEHKFSLSGQKFSGWLKDQFKAAILSYVILLILLGAFYYLARHYPATWWAIVSLFWIFFSLVLAKLTPLVIIPLFFKYKDLSDTALKERILALASKMQVKLLGVYEIDFSKKTLKANAAFVGLGSGKRILLADTLKGKYSPDEIEVILAHEFSHYRLRHLLKLVLINSCAIIFSLYLLFSTSALPLRFFGLSSLTDIAAVPLIIIYMFVLGIIIQPLQNYLSRRFERQADALAVKVTGHNSAFISAMEKLALQNLADRNPHWLIKLFFFDHPPIDERIAMAKAAS
ncbi:MAG: M48 family metallopeptidase [Candidatus Omnitrophota bacterium]